jgi:hypothetical protein
MAHDDEKVRSAAAFAVGGVAAGQTMKYFPTLLDYLCNSKDSHERTLLLHAVKEVPHRQQSQLTPGYYIQFRAISGSLLE